MPVEGPYTEVRALERGLTLIEALGEIGWSGPADLARHTGIDRSTIYRLLSTMVGAGFVVRRPQDSKYFLSSKFRALSFGIQDQDRRALLVSEPLKDLVHEIKWPSDFVMLTAGRLVIIDSNHPQTTMTFYRAVIGQTRPILRSSLGRAMLAAMSEEELQNAIQTILLADGPDAEEVRDRAAVGAVIETTRERGYALSIGELTPEVTAIALPVMSGGTVAGAINVVFFSSAFKMAQVETYLDALRRCVTRVEQAFMQKDVGEAQSAGKRAVR